MPPVSKKNGAAAESEAAAPPSIQDDALPQANAAASADPNAGPEPEASAPAAEPEPVVFDPSIPSVSLRAPEGATACAVDGVQYEVDPEGRVLVIERHATVLLGLGFSY